MNNITLNQMRKITILSLILVFIFGVGVSLVQAQPEGFFEEQQKYGNTENTSNQSSGGTEYNGSLGSDGSTQNTGSLDSDGGTDYSGPLGSDGGTDYTGLFENPLKFKSFLGFFQAVVRGVIVPVGVVIAVLALIYSGFLFVVAQGNEEKIRKARMTFFYTVVGTILLLGAWAIVEAITGTVCQIANVPGLCQ